jgi:23S rRNA pseudouridine2457 synthase
MQHQHFKLFKPYGYLSQFQSNAKHERNKRFLGELYDFPEGTMAIGRLDKDSEGLLLLTTDGQLSYDICNLGIEKEYYVLVDGVPTEAALIQLKSGVILSHKGETYLTKPCKVKLLKTLPDFPERNKKIRDERHGKSTWISITITEGKFRQVRKMTSKVGFPTLRLVRVRVGNITLEALKMGEVKALNKLLG